MLNKAVAVLFGSDDDYVNIHVLLVKARIPQIGVNTSNLKKLPSSH